MGNGMAGALFELEPVGPAPGREPLRLRLECRTTPNRRGRMHEISIGADWTLTTPHDLAVERVGVALGGYLACVELADQVLPALRQWTQLQKRRVRPALRRGPDQSWQLNGTDTSCGCANRCYASVHKAVDHLGGERHWTAGLSASARRIWRRVSDEVAAAHDGFAAPRGADTPLREARACVFERDGLDKLWQAGIALELIVPLHRELTASAGDAVGPLPAALLEAAVYGEAPLALLADVLAGTEDLETVAWVARTATEVDVRHPEARMDWLRLGASRAETETLLASDYQPTDAHAIAASTDRSPRRSAHQLAEWARAGCQPQPADFLALDRAGADAWFAPTPTTVSTLIGATRQLRQPPTSTEVGLVLAVAGNVRTARRLLERGARDPRTAAHVLDPTHHLEETG